MTRRRDRAPTPTVDDGALAWRYLWTGRFAMNVEPGTPGDALRKRIARERDALDKSAIPVADRLAALEAFIAELGYEASLRRFIDRMLSARSGHAPPDDFSNRRRGAGRRDRP